MKHNFLILLLAASSMAASAQPSTATAKPATATAKSVTKAAKPATARAARSAATAAKSTATAGILPPGVPPVKAPVQTLFTTILRYQDIKVGTGAVAEAQKLYKIQYTGWLAADGRKFDSSYDHPRPPLKDKAGKPVLGPDGKPQLSEPQPLVFPQGFGRVISGLDAGFEGMRIGGQRRLFIPWRLAYGEKGRPGPDATHPGIPGKADLIFDIELVDVTDFPKPPARPNVTPGNHSTPGGAQIKPGTAATPAKSGTAATPAVAPKTAASAATTAPAAKTAAPASTPAAAAPTTPAKPQSK